MPPLSAIAFGCGALSRAAKNNHRTRGCPAFPRRENRRFSAERGRAQSHAIGPAAAAQMSRGATAPFEAGNKGAARQSAAAHVQSARPRSVWKHVPFQCLSAERSRSLGRFALWKKALMRGRFMSRAGLPPPFGRRAIRPPEYRGCLSRSAESSFQIAPGRCFRKLVFYGCVRAPRACCSKTGRATREQGFWPERTSLGKINSKFGDFMCFGTCFEEHLGARYLKIRVSILVNANNKTVYEKT